MAAAEAAAEAASCLLEDPAVAELAEYGYPASEAAAALEQSGGHVHAALALLHARLAAAAAATGSSSSSGGSAGAGACGPAAAAGADDALADWQEEREALEAIYGGDVRFHSDRYTELRLPVELTSAAAMAASGNQHELTLQLDFIAPSAVVEGGGGARGGSPSSGSGCGSSPAAAYPLQPPVVGVRAAGVPAAALLTLTHVLAKQAVQLAGHPMLYELGSAAVESFERCLLQPLPLSKLLPPAGSGRRDAELVQQAERQLRLEDIHNSIVPPAARRRQGGGGRGAGGGSGLNLAAESRRLSQHQAELERSAEHAAMRAVRAKLPAAAQRGEVLALCATRQVVVVSGATGCGKSTQARAGSMSAPDSRIFSCVMGHACGHLPTPSAATLLALACLATLPPPRINVLPHNCLLQGPVLPIITTAPSAALLLLCLLLLTCCFIADIAAHRCLQVPQFILEEAVAAGRGAACSIICTQPRRISAVGLASRVSAERGEQVGSTVGYSVRLDSKQSARTRLLFCTTGVCLPHSSRSLSRERAATADGNPGRHSHGPHHCVPVLCLVV